MIIGWPSQISSSFSFRCWRMGSLELIKLGFEKRWVWLMSWHFLSSFTKLNSTLASLGFVIHSYIWRWHRLVLGGVGVFEVFSYITLSADPPLPSPPNQKHLLEANYVASNNSKRNNFFISWQSLTLYSIALFLAGCTVQPDPCANPGNGRSNERIQTKSLGGRCSRINLSL